MIPRLPSGLTHRAGLDQIVDRAALESRFHQHRDTVLPDIGRRAQIVILRQPAMPGVRGL